MNNFFRANIFLTVGLLLCACGQSGPAPSPTMTPAVRQTAELVQRVTATASFGPTLLPFPPTQEPTFLPTIEPTQISGLLSNSFSVQTLNALNGHSLIKITGWSYGFRPSGYCFGPYEWMNQNHLLLFPLVGQEYGMGIIQLSLPVVINYESGKVWIPSSGDPSPLSLSSCDRPLWSNTLNILITTQGEQTIIFSPEGDLINRYPGTNASLSPSGTKLMAGGVWMDLLSGKKVDFSSQGLEGLSTWSSDENELYSCCYAYGNVLTGKAYTFELGGLRYVGRDYGDGFTGIRNLWVMNDTYVVTHWDFQDDTDYDIFPLIEPSTQTYKDLQELTDIPDDSSCRLGSVAPDRKRMWVNCYQPSNYLVNLETFAVEPYPGELNVVSWTSSSNFAWLRTFITDNSPQILSTSTKKLQLLPVAAQVGTIFWHPADDVLAYLSEDGKKLGLLDAQSMSIQERELPSTSGDIVWSPNGEHIALAAEDGSLWQVDYPKLENLEQLTAPLPNVHDLQWSPDGTHLAFISGTDIYIVETIK